VVLFPVGPNSNKVGVGENMVFSSFVRQYLENGTSFCDQLGLLLTTNRKLHMRLRLAPIKVDDLEWL